MKAVSFLATFCALAGLAATAQSPADGRVAGHSYVNSYLHFSYSWPPILQPQDLASLQLGPHPNPNESLLFAARQGNEPYGIIMLSEKLNTPWHSFAGFKDGPDFLRRIPVGQSPEDHFKILSSKHATTSGGFPVDELDYSVGGEYDSGIAVRTGDYIVVFRCNAKSLADLAVMTNSVLATRSEK
jgi:hypothetical protein